MDNKTYKMIAELVHARHQRLQELELSGEDTVYNFIYKYLIDNLLTPYFTVNPVENNESIIYLDDRGRRKELFRVGNRQIKTNLLKRLGQLENYLKEEQRDLLNFYRKLRTQGLKATLNNNKLQVEFNLPYCMIIIYVKYAKPNMILFEQYETTYVIVKDDDDYHSNTEIQQNIYLKKSKWATVDDFIQFVNELYKYIEQLEKSIKN